MLSVTRAQVIGLLLPLVALLALAGTRLARIGGAEEQNAAPVELVERAAGPGRSPPLVVHVVGAVRLSGLYQLVEGARIDDAIRKAGGATRRADLAMVNLAAPLVDGQQVVVPARAVGVDSANPAAAASGAPAGPAARVSLSTATVEQLDELPGIGPVTAQKIVDWRAANGAFASVDDLDAVPGIGESRIEQLRDLVTP